MTAGRFRVETGSPYPPGATWDGKGVNFALFSAHAERVQLCLFDRFDPHSGFLDVLRQDPVLSRTKLIAEPWDLGPYCQDNPIGWVDWRAPRAGADLVEFARHLLALRRAHRALKRDRFLTGGFVGNGTLEDVAWLVPDGREKTEADWNFPDARSLCFLLAASSPAAGAPESDQPLLIFMNAHVASMVYRAPEVAGIAEWVCLLDTAFDTGRGGTETLPAGAKIEIAPRTVVVLRGRGPRAEPAP